MSRFPPLKSGARFKSRVNSRHQGKKPEITGACGFGRSRSSAAIVESPPLFHFARPAWHFAAPALSRGYTMLLSNFGATALVLAIIFTWPFTPALPVEAAHVRG
jgi:hypothetical protein